MCAATGPSFAQRATRHAGVAVSYFFYTRPQIVITILFFFNATNTSCCICADKSCQRQACAARDPRLARYEMSRETDPCLFGDGTSPIWKKPSMHPYPTKLRFRFPGQQRRFFFPAASPFVLLIAHFFTCRIRSPVFLFISSSFFVFFFTGYTLFAFAIVHMCIYISKC